MRYSPRGPSAACARRKPRPAVRIDDHRPRAPIPRRIGPAGVQDELRAALARVGRSVRGAECRDARAVAEGEVQQAPIARPGLHEQRGARPEPATPFQRAGECALDGTGAAPVGVGLEEGPGQGGETHVAPLGPVVPRGGWTVPALVRALQAARRPGASATRVHSVRFADAVLTERVNPYVRRSAGPRTTGRRNPAVRQDCRSLETWPPATLVPVVSARSSGAGRARSAGPSSPASRPRRARRRGPTRPRSRARMCRLR